MNISMGISSEDKKVSMGVVGARSVPSGEAQPPIVIALPLTNEDTSDILAGIAKGGTVAYPAGETMGTLAEAVEGGRIIRVSVPEFNGTLVDSSQYQNGGNIFAVGFYPASGINFMIMVRLEPNATNIEYAVWRAFAIPETPTYNIGGFEQTAESAESGGLNTWRVTLKNVFGETRQYDFNVRNGAQGEQGAQGAQGERGVSPTVTVNPTENGHEVIISDDEGQQSFEVLNGEQGEAATIQIGTVTTGEPNTEAAVTNVGTETNAVFDFIIPRGADGSGGGGEEWEKLGDVTLTESVAEITFTPPSLKRGVLIVYFKPNADYSKASPTVWVYTGGRNNTVRFVKDIANNRTTMRCYAWSAVFLDGQTGYVENGVEGLLSAWTAESGGNADGTYWSLQCKDTAGFPSGLRCILYGVKR